MKGILAFDIDGTLTHRLDWVDPKVAEALKQLSTDGWHIALLTGRIFSFAHAILQYFHFPYLLAVQNGADIITMPDKSHLFQQYLSAEIIPDIEKAYEGAGEDFIIYAGIDNGDFCYYRPERLSPKMIEYTKKLESLGAAPWQPSDFNFPKDKKFPLIKCFGKQEAMKRVYDRLQGNKNIEISLICDPVDPSLYLNLITHPNANKGGVVHFLREHFKAPLVIAAGDDHNDLKMLKEADIRIAIETAPEEVLAYTDIRARPASELGILPAIEEAIALAKR